MLTRRLALAAALAPIALPVIAEGNLPNISGSYEARGMNSDGSKYKGRAEIVQQGNSVEIGWVVSGQAYRGSGRFDGRVLSIDWGAPTPIVYVLMGNELHGTWEGGTALEKLTPR